MIPWFHSFRRCSGGTSVSRLMRSIRVVRTVRLLRLAAGFKQWQGLGFFGTSIEMRSEFIENSWPYMHPCDSIWICFIKLGLDDNCCFQMFVFSCRLYKCVHFAVSSCTSYSDSHHMEINRVYWIDIYIYMPLPHVYFHFSLFSLKISTSPSSPVFFAQQLWVFPLLAVSEVKLKRVIDMAKDRITSEARSKCQVWRMKPCEDRAE